MAAAWVLEKPCHNVHSASSATRLNWLIDESAPFRHGKIRFVLANAAVLAALIVAICTQLIFGSLAALIFAVAAEKRNLRAYLMVSRMEGCMAGHLIHTIRLGRSF